MKGLTEKMQMTSYLQERRLTIALAGDIDHHTAGELMPALGDKIDSFMPSVCVLDFRDVGFMDSSGIAVVISAQRHMKALEGEVWLKNLPRQSEKVLKTVGIERIVKIV